MRSSRSENSRRSRSPYIGLDLLRAAAAVIVFLGHVRGTAFVEFGALPIEDKGLITKLLFGVTRMGHEAVMVFFVLSGFLVGGQIIRHLDEDHFNVESYALERSTRILLPLIPACVLTVAVNWAFFGYAPNWSQAAFNMVGMNGILVDTLPNNAPLWSLAYEIWFYLIAGGAAFLFVQRDGALAAFIVVACSACVFTILDARYLIFWCLGALSVFLIGSANRGVLAAVGTALSILGCYAYELAAGSKSFVNVVYAPYPFSEAVICVGVSLTIPWLCDDEVNAKLAPARKIAVYLSGLSYTLYLVHYPINQALSLVMPRSTDFALPSLAIFALRVILIFVIADLFFRVFEANTGTVRRYLRRRISSSRQKGVDDKVST